MSGIAGVFNLDGSPLNIDLLGRMTTALEHRGCDGARRWQETNVALGHYPLYATPESFGELQPLEDTSGAAVVTFDGRLDNRGELISLLRSKAQPSTTDTDAELVLKSYLCWGEDCPRRIVGDFAFAIWDKRTQQLFCARDPIGIKPFYYYFQGNRFLFCSEIQPLFKDATVHAKPNIPLIARYMAGDFSERHETLYTGIYALPPSHYMVVSRDGVRLSTRYWDIDPEATIRYDTSEQYADHYLHLFREAVKCRMRAPGPVGALLSGGVDSSSIVCTAQRLMNEGVVPVNTLETFSAVSRSLPLDDEGEVFDERDYIKEVLTMYNVRSNFCWYEEQEPYQDLVEAARCFPDVPFNPAISIFSSLLRAAKQKGVRIVLSGVGGDEIHGADSDIYLYRYADLIRELRARELASDLRIALKYYPPSEVGKLLWAYGIRPLITSIRASLLGGQRLSEEKPFSSMFRKHIYRELVYGHNTGVALEAFDKFFSYQTLEPRYPYFDVRLIKFVMAIPHDEVCRHYQTKLVLRRSMKGYLPEAIRRRRTKATAASLVDREFREVHKETIERILRAPSLLEGIDWPRVRDTFARYCRGSLEDHSEVLTLERALGFELWYRSMIQRRGGG